MRNTATRYWTLAAFLLSSVFLFQIQPAAAEDSSQPSTTATRPAKTLPDQVSVPNNSPPATTDRTTGQANPNPTIKKMNEEGKRKVETEGK